MVAVLLVHVARVVFVGLLLNLGGLSLVFFLVLLGDYYLSFF